ncbi:restriction endonuclease [Desulfurococcus mucosus]|uniref:Restriction endonuclease type IV Mrr domain-containing protein n=1 Tax=Desulfurococcus mucosus (strain ATCC 35584 / DSM 2162 / JCM 9187 / O7/1) TaxID=765177 RepID=E8R960_DESM0|nr:restriction endonuclease [Desulfurococcus mucosus]ADV65036.1 hypothetical protein Desmu_0730 [Desulfurococcus mucosus DSM 2162]
MVSSLEKEILLRILGSRRILLDELEALYRVPEENLLGILERNRDIIALNGRTVAAVKPLELALRLLEQGVSIERISRAVDWRDFEQLASYVMSEHGYLVESNITLTTPVRLEIDVVGVDTASGLGIAVDCKHWSHNTRGKLIEAGTRHVERLEKALSHYDYLKEKYLVFKHLKEAVPVILTLRQPSFRAYGNVVFISVREFNEFLGNIRYIIDVFGVKPVKPS